jgi:HlyD family secretion protein
MTRSRKKWIGLGIGVVIVVGLLVGLAGRGQVPAVTVAQVSRQTLDAWISSNGKVEPVRPYAIRAQLATFVNRVDLAEGQRVKRGQLLLELDASDAEAQLASARQSLLGAENDLRTAREGGPPEQVAQLESDLAKAQAKRDRLAEQQAALKKLVQSHAATPDELAENQLGLNQAQADLDYLLKKKQDLARQARLAVSQDSLRIEQARAEIAVLQDKVRQAHVTAAIDGTVYSLPVRPGDYVKVGDLLFEMADLHNVQVRAFVDEPDLGQLNVNDPVEITWDALPKRVWRGSTMTIPKQVVSFGTRSVGEVLCSVNNEGFELLPGINVDVRIEVQRRQNVLVVPRGAVQGEGAARYVLLVRNNRLQKRAIEVGIASATQYEVTAGLAPGDRVALPGTVDLQDGMEIRPVER